MYNRFEIPIKITAHNKSLVEAAKSAVDKLYDEIPVSLPYSKFRLFECEGRREEYEMEYMRHRKMLCAFTVMALTESDEKWFDKLLDIVWAVCDEYTWALPAHLLKANGAYATVTCIDLFASETAGALCEIYHLFESKLPAAVRERIEYEVRRRIMEPYKMKRNRFGISNWSAVCSFGVGAAFVYLGTSDEFEDIKENLLLNMYDFLDSYTADGCCQEGPLYWTYGFSHFCYLAELLREYTNGEINFFLNEKVKKIAYFYQNINLGENYFVPFSDAPHTCSYDASLLGILSDNYEGIHIPPSCYENKFGEFGNDSRYRFAPLIRNLYWGKTASDKNYSEDGYVYYNDAQWYVNKNNSYTFAVKGGHNSEPHNHNDVGSFIVFDSGRFIIDDPGWAKYTRAYFDGEKRYENICASSLGHSVPVVNGKGQMYGSEYKAEAVSADDNRFCIELSAAYNCPELDGYKREFVLEKSRIIIKDNIKTSANVCSRFITSICPQKTDNGVCIDEYTLVCSKGISPLITEYEYSPRFEGFSAETEVVKKIYAIDFDVSGYTLAEYILTKN